MSAYTAILTRGLALFFDSKKEEKKKVTKTKLRAGRVRQERNQRQ